MPLPSFESQDIEFLRRQFKAWVQGAESRANQFCQLSDNPHPARSPEGDAWENGFERMNYAIYSTDERESELKAAIFRGGYDISPCKYCSKDVVCIPDGLPMCEPCALKQA